ncbi:MAG: FAD-binding oxidoreductase, partial [Pseudomonadota bacterium]
MAQPVLSWGRVFRYDHDVSHFARLDRVDLSDFGGARSTIFHGMGRSYGDVALNEGAGLCVATARDNVLAFDRETGVLRAQSGLTLAQLNAVAVPSGWITPVSPGTKFVTLGGAVANDVHGKNHHLVGSFGAHVRALCLRRSDGETLTCSPDESVDLFNATISGLGLTGYIEWVEVQLKKIGSSNLQIENYRYGHLDEFFEWSETSADWPYTAAWIDCFAPKSHTGEGIFTRARFADDGVLSVPASSKAKTFPFELPGFALNKHTISAFNWAYKRRWGSEFIGLQDYQDFFYPLDSINDWNKLYGRKGFYQHQSILPINRAREGVMALLEAIRKSG